MVVLLIEQQIPVLLDGRPLVATLLLTVIRR
jgi:hypothetical protein